MIAVIDLATLAADIGWPDQQFALTAARRARLGRLGELIEFLTTTRAEAKPTLTRPRLVVLLGDEGIAAAGVSAQPEGATARRWSALRDGTDPLARLAGSLDIGIDPVDVSIAGEAAGDDRLRSGSGRIDVEDAMTADETDRALRLGVAVADRQIDEGTDLLLVAGTGAGSSTAAATTVSVLAGVEPVKVTGRGSGIDDEAWMRKAAAIRDARRRSWTKRFDVPGLLGSVGGPVQAATTGFLLQAAVRRTPVIVDGLTAAVAASVAGTVAQRAALWWRVAQTVPEPAQPIALHRLAINEAEMSPVLDLGLAGPDGAGALIVAAMLRAGLELRG